MADFSKTLKGYDVVYFCAGAGGKGSEERTKKVDYEGALKIFDALEGVEGSVKPRLILVSAVDVRDPEKIPEHYVSIIPSDHSKLSFFSFFPRMKTISYNPPESAESSQNTCIGSTKQIKIL